MADRICSIAGCDRNVVARGWCGTHYERWRHGIDMTLPVRKLAKPQTKKGDGPENTCSIEDCDGRRYCRGWCIKHYKRWCVHGDPVRERPTPEQRFWAKVDKTGMCWVWTAAMIDGYGDFYDGSAYILAHRFSYQLAHGRIPQGMRIDHLCFNHACVNPDHLRLATQKQNGENRAGPQSNNQSSGVRGVTWNKKTKKWHAQVTHQGRNHYAGEFSILDDAEAAVIAKRNDLFTHNYLDRRPA